MFLQRTAFSAALRRSAAAAARPAVVSRGFQSAAVRRKLPLLESPPEVEDGGWRNFDDEARQKSYVKEWIWALGGYGGRELGCGDEGTWT